MTCYHLTFTPFYSGTAVDPYPDTFEPSADFGESSILFAQFRVAELAWPNVPGGGDTIQWEYSPVPPPPSPSAQWYVNPQPSSVGTLNLAQLFYFNSTMQPFSPITVKAKVNGVYAMGTAKITAVTAPGGWNAHFEMLPENPCSDGNFIASIVESANATDILPLPAPGGFLLRNRKIPEPVLSVNRIIPVSPNWPKAPRRKNNPQ